MDYKTLAQIFPYSFFLHMEIFALNRYEQIAIIIVV